MKKLISRLLGGSSEQPLTALIVQFIKFGIVGVSNTAISYGVELLCYYVLLVNAALPENAKVIVTSVLAFVISVTNSYFWNNKYVFGSGVKKDMRAHLKAYFRSVLCYGTTGLIISPAIKMLLVGQGMEFWIASLISMALVIPLNFLLNKLWAFGKSA